jgi:hypothetical protein
MAHAVKKPTEIQLNADQMYALWQTVSDYIDPDLESYAAREFANTLRLFGEDEACCMVFESKASGKRSRVSS